MGSGSSKPRKANKTVQVPSASKTRIQTPPPSPIKKRSRRHSHRPYSSSPTPWLNQPNQQRFQSNSTLAHYASIWENNGKLSSTFEQLIRTGSVKIEHEQKETKTNKTTTTHQSKSESAQVDSTLISEIESIHSLSTSDKIDTLIINLKQTQLDFDESVKRRIGQITTETESILSQIVEETQLSQQQLLINAKEQQTIQDEQYRILLEDFIQKLDEKRAKQLAFIQEQLQEQRLDIFNQSQLKIRALNEQANSVKTQIMSQEERKAAQTIDTIINEINSISTESAIQNIATEIKTNINLTVIETVGSATIHDQHTIKRTTYLETNPRPSSGQSIQTQLKSTKQYPTNSTKKS